MNSYLFKQSNTSVLNSGFTQFGNHWTTNMKPNFSSIVNRMAQRVRVKRERKDNLSLPLTTVFEGTVYDLWALQLESMTRYTCALGIQIACAGEKTGGGRTQSQTRVINCEWSTDYISSSNSFVHIQHFYL